MSNNLPTLVPTAPKTAHIRLEVDEDRPIYWMFMHTSEQQAARPCCSLPIVQDGVAILEYVSRVHKARQVSFGRQLGHVVLGSDAPVFSLGGDLAMFARAIRSNDREALLNYALCCTRAVYGFNNLCDSDLQSIALVQGDALGGGFEVALACNTIIAEEGTQLGFPETMFGLFPGMGAYSFLRRRVSTHQARRMMLDSTLYSAEELHEMGVVDVLVKRTEGVAAAEGLIQDRRRCGIAYRTVARLERKYAGVPKEELDDVTQEWVDSALELGDKGIQTMERILKAQSRRFATDPAALHVQDTRSSGE
ncbi:MAG TPA: crotonase/enoyl-CoA hydratase family protein [Burkholderiales bacterium]|nr:crotonase/enoyl-CoA hydratase family protein [Burkholderiales bacterium]